MRPSLVVTFALDEAGKALVAEELGAAGEVVHLPELDDGARLAALRRATAVLARNTARELRPGELAEIAGARLLQFVPAGIDFIPLQEVPDTVVIASNGGAYAEPMAEHALAMALAAAKRLVLEHGQLAQGAFNQQAPNRMLAGGVCGILGFGGIGLATARLMRCLGMRVHAINRRGAGDGALDWVGTPDRLDELLRASDVLVLCLPLTRSTRGMLGARELRLMKPNAILVNLARGEIIDEAALYAHLREQPEFTACIDAWWVEPVRHGRFAMDHPFMDLPNVIASPHNSASVPAAHAVGLRRAVANCRRALAGEAVLHVVDRGELSPV